MKKIALVEDNPDNRLLVAAILEDQYAVAEYETGSLALDGMRSNVPDLVLLDISLPEMSGDVVLSHIRGDDTLARLPVIALTAHAMAGDRERFLKLGFDGYIAKPITDEDVLLAAIQQLIDRSNSPN